MPSRRAETQNARKTITVSATRGKSFFLLPSGAAFCRPARLLRGILTAPRPFVFSRTQKEGKQRRVVRKAIRRFGDPQVRRSADSAIRMFSDPQAQRSAGSAICRFCDLQILRSACSAICMFGDPQIPRSAGSAIRGFNDPTARGH